MKRYLRWVMGLGLVLAAPVVAQEHGWANDNQPRGGGLSGGSVNPRVLLDLVYEGFGVPATNRLAALVVWKGQPDWAATHNPRDHDAVRDSMAARSASRREDWIAGGTCHPRRCAWVEFDPSGRSLLVLGRSFVVPVRDSTLVVLVDNIDQETPSVQTFLIASATRTEAECPSPGMEHVRREETLNQEHYGQIARGDPRVRAFVGEWDPEMGARAAEARSRTPCG